MVTLRPVGVQSQAMTNAVLYVPVDADFYQYSRALHTWCETRGYTIDDTLFRDGWDEVRDYAVKHELVIVVGDAAHVPADRLPRVEVADLSAARPDLPRWGGPDRRRQRPGPF